MTDPVSKGKHFEEYDISWLFWLLGEGQSFFVRLEKKLELTAKLGESYEVFIANPADADSQLSSENFKPGRRYERAWISSDKCSDNSHHVGGDPPGLPYDYFSDEEVIAKRGPDPDMLRYFLELLGYQCTLRTKKGESILKIKWVQRR